MSKKNALVPAISGFSYDTLDTTTANQIHAATERIRLRLKKSVEAIIAIGNDLLTVKKTLHHGQFGLWLQTEFGWRERTAQNFMAVAERFGAKSAKFADLAIQPSAPYLLAEPTTPDVAREAALKRAEAGEQITLPVAKRILAAVRKKPLKRTRPLPGAFLATRLQKTLQWYKERWDPKDVADLQMQLKQFLVELDTSLVEQRSKGAFRKKVKSQ